MLSQLITGETKVFGGPGFKEIMQNVSKQQAKDFMNYLNKSVKGWYPTSTEFTKIVEEGVKKYGNTPNVKFNANTANAIINQMERKSGIKF